MMVLPTLPVPPATTMTDMLGNVDRNYVFDFLEWSDIKDYLLPTHIYNYTSFTHYCKFTAQQQP